MSNDIIVTDAMIEAGREAAFELSEDEARRCYVAMERERLESAATLFRRGAFTSAAGLPLDWKIECDALTPADWECIAYVGAQMVPPFWRVLGVPRGGLPLAQAFQRHVTRGARHTLICDDVWTTGKSMRAVAAGLPDWHGFVAFARGPLDDNVTAFLAAGG
jgi:hypothetical protein